MRTEQEILNAAIVCYEANDYGRLPENKEMLPRDTAFCNFYDKYKTAYQYYAGNYPDFIVDSHINGIDFNHPVEIVIIPAGQMHTQTQVPWGARGNYYSSSDQTPSMLGIASQGRIFDAGFVPAHQKNAYDENVKSERENLLGTLSDDRSFDEAFPALPSSQPNPNKSAVIADKMARTYEATEDVRVLKSTSKEILDTWSVPNQKIHCSGGGVQLYASHQENEKLKQAFRAQDDPENNRYIKPS